jgi:putative hydrolase of the HAD superfamily
MSSVIHTVILDFGNVISKPQNQTQVSTMCRLTHQSTDSFKKAYNKYRLTYDQGLLNGTEYWTHILNDLGQNPDPAIIQQLIQADIQSWSDIDTRIIYWAMRLKAQGYHIAILSNLPIDQRKHYQQHFDWIKTFDHTFYSCDIKAIKPQPQIYEHVIQTLNCPAQHLLFIDDKQENVDGAQKTGINAILYTTFEQLAKDLKPYNIPTR